MSTLITELDELKQKAKEFYSGATNTKDLNYRKNDFMTVYSASIINFINKGVKKKFVQQACGVSPRTFSEFCKNHKV